MAVRALLSLLAFCFTQSALATMITISADDYARNSIITSGKGVTFNTWTQASRGSPVIEGPSVMAIGCDSLEAWSCVPGVQSFGSEGDYAPWFNPHQAIWCLGTGSINTCDDDGFFTLNVTFDEPTDYVSVSGVWGNDALGIWALDVNGNLLERCVLEFDMCGTVTYDPGTFAYLSFGIASITRSQADIATLLIGGYSAAGATANTISYRAVPEPATALMFMSGLVGLLLARQRRTRLRTPESSRNRV